MKTKILKIHPHDNVLVALCDLPAGEKIVFENNAILLTDSIPAKHKFTERNMAPEEDIIMYGTLVGKATQAIAAGGAITTKNVKHEASSFTGKTKTTAWLPPDVTRWRNKTFMGYHRNDGQVGVANYWLIVPMVFCENRNVTVIQQAFEEALGFTKPNAYKNYVQELVALVQQGKPDAIHSLPFENASTSNEKKVFRNIDGIKFLRHEGGCGGTRQDAEALCALLAGYINNPNVAGATVLSLGCQHAQTSILKEKLQHHNPNFSKPLLIFEQQQAGTEEELLVQAIRQTFSALIKADEQERKPAPLSKLVIGLECGGSDGFSGISANPAVGHASDLVVALGGKTVLSEFPELCGVEQELINRCTDDDTANRFIHLMHTYAKAAAVAGSGFDMNPSPGNIKDGLITDAIKSAGAAKKGGTSPVADVLDYGEYIRKPGLTLLCTPGNDVESTTAMTGSGCNIILFTTGLGTPTGNPITPVIKISSNSSLAARMPDIIDLDSGAVISGEKTIQEVGEEILDYILEVASGHIKTKAEILRQDDFIPWKRGVSL
ncbi:MAG: altronate dehydratase [Cyclobacteriaceae bacterium]|nr:altronate dehydratase [Cyclobacteriaceae bacterium]